jgi:hypothetical protein
VLRFATAIGDQGAETKIDAFFNGAAMRDSTLPVPEREMSNEIAACVGCLSLIGQCGDLQQCVMKFATEPLASDGLSA